eukprot:6225394-Prymnesium_polylepis.1
MGRLTRSEDGRISARNDGLAAAIIRGAAQYQLEELEELHVGGLEASAKVPSVAAATGAVGCAEPQAARRAVCVRLANAARESELGVLRQLSQGGADALFDF